ncbi:hypothetical protein niasHT_023809 [Heterodera trifolii]|uniref:Peptidase M24 domain-containing protein n=1 Tax=Heterodera trifolii TaxID=157864 RepID=A0ABD2JRU3_9BILA
MVTDAANDKDVDEPKLRHCQSKGREKPVEGNLRCPTSVKIGRLDAFFCSQTCFKGPPHKCAARCPEHIPRPDYALHPEGVSLEERNARNSGQIRVLNEEEKLGLRLAAKLGCEVLDEAELDVTVFHCGFHGDLNETFLFGDAVSEKLNLIMVTYECLRQAIDIVRPGVKFRDIGNVIQKHANANGFSVVKRYCGHCIHRLFHTAQNVPHYAKNKTVGVMKAGNAFTIEPMINTGAYGRLISSNALLVFRTNDQWPDGCTAVTKDGTDPGGLPAYIPHQSPNRERERRMEERRARMEDGQQQKQQQKEHEAEKQSDDTPTLAADNAAGGGLNIDRIMDDQM